MTEHNSQASNLLECLTQCDPGGSKPIQAIKAGAIPTRPLGPVDHPTHHQDSPVRVKFREWKGLVAKQVGKVASLYPRWS